MPICIFRPHTFVLDRWGVFLRRQLRRGRWPLRSLPCLRPQFPGKSYLLCVSSMLSGYIAPCLCSSWSGIVVLLYCIISCRLYPYLLTCVHRTAPTSARSWAGRPTRDTTMRAPPRATRPGKSFILLYNCMDTWLHVVNVSWCYVPMLICMCYRHLSVCEVGDLSGKFGRFTFDEYGMASAVRWLYIPLLLL